MVEPGNYQPEGHPLGTEGGEMDRGAGRNLFDLASSMLEDADKKDRDLLERDLDLRNAHATATLSIAWSLMELVDVLKRAHRLE